MIKYVLDTGLKLERNGAWIDLATAEDYYFNNYLGKVSLGIRMDLPNYIEALIIPRSSTFGKYALMLGNSIGLIDPPMTDNLINKGNELTGYCGQGDVWKAPLYCLGLVVPEDVSITPLFKPSIDANLILSKEGYVIGLKKNTRIVQFRLQPTMDAPWWVWMKWIFGKLRFKKVDLLTKKNRDGFGTSG